MIDLSDGELRTVKAILKEQLPNVRVWAFGSRVAGSASRFSDLDLAVVGEQELSIRQLAELRQAFSDSPLPFRVDIVDWASASEAFRKVIENQYVELQ